MPEYRIDAVIEVTPCSCGGDPYLVDLGENKAVRCACGANLTNRIHLLDPGLYRVNVSRYATANPRRPHFHLNSDGEPPSANPAGRSLGFARVWGAPLIPGTATSLLLGFLGLSVALGNHWPFSLAMVGFAVGSIILKEPTT